MDITIRTPTRILDNMDTGIKFASPFSRAVLSTRSVCKAIFA
jgi:hypothetical protein